MNAVRRQQQNANGTLRSLCALLRGLMTPADRRDFERFERELSEKYGTPKDEEK